MAEEVVRVLLGRVPPSSPALLSNQCVPPRSSSSPPVRFHRCRLLPFLKPSRIHPIEFAAAGGSASGAASTRRFCPSTATESQERVFKGITDGELDVLDIFEDEEYVRESVEISMTETPEKMTVYAYIWGKEDGPDLYGEWDFEEWKKVHLKDNLTMTRDFKEELD